MTAPDPLDRELRALARYLVGGEPPPEVAAAYRRAHDDLPELRELPARPPLVDRASLALARWGGPLPRVADAYVRFLRPTGPLRTKLILALALLEHAPPHHLALATATAPGPVGGAVRLVGVGLRFAISLAAGLLILGPLHAVSRPSRPEPHRG